MSLVAIKPKICQISPYSWHRNLASWLPAKCYASYWNYTYQYNFCIFFFKRREFTSKQQEEDWAKRLLATKENQRQLCKILYHLLLLSFWCFTFSNLFWLPHHYFFPAAVLVLSHFLSAWSAPKPAWPPLLVFHHPEIISLQMIKKVTVPDFLYLWLWSQPCRRRFVRRPIASIVANRHRDRHHSTLKVLGFLRADLGKPIKTNMR